jgi:hypothetical protein
MIKSRFININHVPKPQTYKFQTRQLNFNPLIINILSKFSAYFTSSKAHEMDCGIKITNRNLL